MPWPHKGSMLRLGSPTHVHLRDLRDLGTGWIGGRWGSRCKCGVKMAIAEDHEETLHISSQEHAIQIVILYFFKACGIVDFNR